mgnify:CR=1 FL=1
MFNHKKLKEKDELIDGLTKAENELISQIEALQYTITVVENRRAELANLLLKAKELSNDIGDKCTNKAAKALKSYLNDIDIAEEEKEANV